MKMNVKKMLFNIVGGFLVGCCVNKIFKDNKPATSETEGEIFDDIPAETEVTETEVEEV